MKTIPIQSSSSATKPTTTISANPTIPKHAPKLEIIARQSYTMEEKKVLEKTSLINSRIFLPFMEVDLKERFVFPIPFTDKDGLLELAPKQKKEFQDWVRISDLAENPSIIVGSHADFYSIRQTVVSDCSFVASLSGNLSISFWWISFTRISKISNANSFLFSGSALREEVQ